jgi:hypothetical protein
MLKICYNILVSEQILKIWTKILVVIELYCAWCWMFSSTELLTLCQLIMSINFKTYDLDILRDKNISTVTKVESDSIFWNAHILFFQFYMLKKWSLKMKWGCYNFKQNNPTQCFSVSSKSCQTLKKKKEIEVNTLHNVSGKSNTFFSFLQ